jgi:predicted metal-dependent hydrolase
LSPIAAPEPQLTPEERALFDRGVELFNTGFFFECHDALEDVWSGVRGPSRDFFQGLIQVSVAFHHLTNGNPAGAQSLLGRALARFEKYPARYFGFDLAAHRAELTEWRDRIAAASGAELSHAALPRWRFLRFPSPDVAKG